MRRVCAKEATLPTTMGRTMLAAWTAELNAMDARLASRFGRAELRDRARDYLRGLLSGAERKNGWQLAEEVGNTTPYGL